MRLGIQSTMALGLASLLLAVGVISAWLVFGLAGAEAESQVQASQRRRVAAIAAHLELAPLTQASLDRHLDESLVGLSLVGPGLGAPVGDELVLEVLQGSTEATRRVAERHRVVRVIRRGHTRIALVATFTLTPMMRSATQRERVAVLFLVATLTMVLGFGLYLSGRVIVRPIRRLTMATDRIAGQGEVNVLIPVIEGPVELRRLSQAFTEMVARLEAKRAALEAAQHGLLRAEKLATVGRLAAGLAHEVGNPLAAIVGYVEYLQDDRGTPAELQADLLKRMATELERIRRTIRQLLDFARPAPPSPSQMDLKPVVEAAVALVTYERRMQGVHITVEGPALWVWADAARLQQVFVNLLFNAGHALKACPEITPRRGAPPASPGSSSSISEISLDISRKSTPRSEQIGRHSTRSVIPGQSLSGQGQISIRLWAGEDAAVVEVADDGPGVAEAEVALLFEPFHTTKPKGEGTGLGLAICQRLVEEAGGHIALTSPPGGPGATFTITLPFSQLGT